VGKEQAIAGSRVMASMAAMIMEKVLVKASGLKSLLPVLPA